MSATKLFQIGLKSISQVLFLENLVSGFLILLGIALSNYQLAIIAFLSGLLGSWIAYICGVREELVEKGLYGFNSVLTGMALFIFLEGPLKWLIALIFAAFTSFVAASLNQQLKKVNLPTYTLPFIVTTWMALLASYYLVNLQISTTLAPNSLSDWPTLTHARPAHLNGVIIGIGQVFLQDNFWTSCFILAAIFWSNRRLGLVALLGSILGFLSGYLLGASTTMLDMGLYSYNAVLAVMALELYRETEFSFKIGTKFLAGIAAVLLSACFNTIFTPYGLPILTFPFVLTVWLFLGAKKEFVKI